MAQRSDNSVLARGPSIRQTEKISYYWSNLREYYSHFVELAHTIGPAAAIVPLQPLSDPSQLLDLLQTARMCGFLFLDSVTDFSSSYRGRLSWLLVGFQNQGYLVDATTILPYLNDLQELLEDARIVKFAYRQPLLLEDLKREWGIFGCNFFDFEQQERSIGVKKGPGLQGGRLAERPISVGLLQELQERYDSMVKLVSRLGYFLDNEDERKEYPIYYYANHEILIKEHRQPIATYAQEEKELLAQQAERRRRQREEKENSRQNSDSQQDQKEQSPRTERTKALIQLLLKWREHTARLLDRPPRTVLPYAQLLAVAQQRPASILEVIKILSLDHRIACFEQAAKILEVVQLEAELAENEANELSVRGSRKGREGGVRALLADLKWEGREEWLNRRNDESIRLYKEVVSIVELDGSVVEEFGVGLDGAVGIPDISRYVKYAEFLRNNKLDNLKSYYESCPSLETEDVKWKEEWKEDWKEKDWKEEEWKEKDWKEKDLKEEEEEEFIVSHPRSSESLSSISDKLDRTDREREKEREKEKEREMKTMNSLKSPNSSHSLPSQMELGVRSEALPENIEEIYLKAVTVKKGYNKVQKKKGGQKSREQEEFVPSWEQIRCLLQQDPLQTQE